MTSTVTKSPLSYWGSKINHAAEIVSYMPFPSDKIIFVEGFVGSGVVFFNYKPAHAILNDSNKNLINFWNVIRSNLEQMEKELQFVWPSSTWFEEFKNRTDPVGRAIFFYMANRNSFCGMLDVPTYYNQFLPKKFRKEFGEWKKIMDHCTTLAIWDLDFRELFKKLEDISITERYRLLLYLDPPYIKQSHYADDFTTKDHEDLCKLVHECKHQVFLSYGEDPWVRDNYAGMNSIGLKSFHTPKNLTRDELTDRADFSELLISNQPLVKRSKDLRLF